MLQVSDQAKAALKNSLDDEDQSGHVFRLARSGDDLTLGLGAVEEGDSVYDLNGEPILAVPNDIAQELEATIDVEQTNEGTHLVLT